MSFDEPVIKVENLGKRYDIYSNPRDRLKQIIVPRLARLVGQGGAAATYHGNSGPFADFL